METPKGKVTRQQSDFKEPVAVALVLILISSVIYILSK